MATLPLALRSLRAADEAAFRRAYADWDPATGNGHIFARGFDPAADFADYLRLIENHFRGEDLPEGFVPYTSLFAFVGEEMVGMATIRHELNDFLLRIGGHIGYAVIPRARRNGYAKEILRQALLQARALGLTRVLVTCDDDNLASARTIEGGGGILENKADTGPTTPRKRRYWIENP